MHWVSGSNHSSGKSTPLLCATFLRMGQLSLSDSPSLSLPLFLYFSLCLIIALDWVIVCLSGATLQGGTCNQIPRTCFSLSLSVSPFIPCLSSLSSPHPALPPALRFLQSLLHPHPSTCFFFSFSLHTAYPTQPVRARVNNSCALCCNWCHHFNLSWLQLRAAYRVTRGGITHCRAQWAATPDQA